MMKFTLIKTSEYRIAVYEEVVNGTLLAVSYYLDEDEDERARDALAKAAFKKAARRHRPKN